MVDGKDHCFEGHLPLRLESPTSPPRLVPPTVPPTSIANIFRGSHAQVGMTGQAIAMPTTIDRQEDDPAARVATLF